MDGKDRKIGLLAHKFIRIVCEIKKTLNFAIPKCPSGGIGRRAGFKIQ